MLLLAVFISAYLFIAFFAYGIAYFPFAQDRFDFLTNNGIQTAATVEAKRPEQHRSIVYSYSVNSIRYTGIGRAYFGNPGFDDIQPGNILIAFYDPEEPSDSFLGYPQIARDANSRAIWQITLIAPMAPVGLAAMLYGIYCLSRRRRRS